MVCYRDTSVGTVVIPAGTRVATASGQNFTTTAAGSITPTSPIQIPGHNIGEDSGLIPAVADVAGAAGNVEANTIVRFIAKPVGVSGVTNPARFAFGADEESDDSFRSRLKLYVATLARSTPQAQENAVLGAEEPTTGASILFAKAVEDYVNLGNTTLYIDDGTGNAETSVVITGENVTEGLAGPPPDSAAGGETTLYLDNKPVNASALFTLSSSIAGVLAEGVDYTYNPASGQIDFTNPLTTGEVITATTYTTYTGLIREAQKIIDGDPADPVNYPGYRAAGTLTIVKTPQVLIQTVDCSLVILEGFDDDEVKENVKNVIIEHINALGISGDVVRNDLIRKIMSVAGVYDVTMITPAANVILLDDQLARTTDANVTVN